MNDESLTEEFELKRNRADSYAVTNPIPEIE